MAAPLRRGDLAQESAMPRRIAQVDKRPPRVLAADAAPPPEFGRLTARLSLLVITFLSAAGWVVLGGLAYWAFL